MNLFYQILTNFSFRAIILCKLFYMRGESMITRITHSTEETEAFASLLAKHLKGGTVVAFYGGLGMGKTAFTRGLA